MKILLLEDQEYPIEILVQAIKNCFIKHYERFQIDQAKSYNTAKEMIEKNEYDYAFIDHRVPMNDVGNLEDTDFDAFSDSLENIGYRLIETIREKNPNIVIIGTSSLDKPQLRRFPKPDYTVRKDWNNAISDLKTVLEKVKIEN